MATEKTEPRTALISGIAVGTIAIILVLRFFLISYFNQMIDEETFRKSGGRTPQQLVTQRAHERELLENGAVPIAQAMHLVSEGGRPATITPTPSTDFAPLQGWTQRPTGWHPPAPPTIAPGPTLQPGAPTMQGGPATENGAQPAPAPGATAPTTAPTAAPAPAAAPAAAPTHAAPPAVAAPAQAAPAAPPAHEGAAPAAQ